MLWRKMNRQVDTFVDDVAALRATAGKMTGLEEKEFRAMLGYVQLHIGMLKKDYDILWHGVRSMSALRRVYLSQSLWFRLRHWRMRFAPVGTWRRNVDAAFKQLVLIEQSVGALSKITVPAE